LVWCLNRMVWFSLVVDGHSLVAYLLKNNQYIGGVVMEILHQVGWFFQKLALVI
jgi:hypothetical protein